MKTRWLTSSTVMFVVMLAWPMRSPAAVYVYSGSTYTIPDGNPNGVWSSVTVSGQPHQLVNVSVLLNVSSGYNGHLYAYLSFDGWLVPLLNRIGVSSANPFGSDGAGMNVIFTDNTFQNIHAAGDGFLSGSYRADGQSIGPLSPAGNFNANGGNITLDGTFANINPNGNWTLYMADVVGGGGPTTVNTWSLEIIAVPEPRGMTLALAIASAGACFRALRRNRK